MICSPLILGESVGIKGWNGAERQKRSDGLCGRSKEQANWIYKWYDIGSCQEHRGRHILWVLVDDLSLSKLTFWSLEHLWFACFGSAFSLMSHLLVAVFENNQWLFHWPFNTCVPKMFLPFFTPRKDSGMKINIFIIFHSFKYTLALECFS